MSRELTQSHIFATQPSSSIGALLPVIAAAGSKWVPLKSMNKHAILVEALDLHIRPMVGPGLFPRSTVPQQHLR